MRGCSEAGFMLLEYYSFLNCVRKSGKSNLRHTLIREVGYRKYKISEIRILPAQAPGESRCYDIRCFSGDSESNPQSSSGTRRKERYIRERTSRSKGVTRGAGESARHRLAPRTDPGHRLA